jgi:hypothetical protein
LTSLRSTSEVLLSARLGASKSPVSSDCILWAKEIRDRSWLLYTSCQIGLCLTACYLAPFQGCKSNTFAGEKRGL